VLGRQPNYPVNEVALCAPEVYRVGNEIYWQQQEEKQSDSKVKETKFSCGTLGPIQFGPLTTLCNYNNEP